jgi:hypothetical protein
LPQVKIFALRKPFIDYNKLVKASELLGGWDQTDYISANHYTDLSASGWRISCQLGAALARPPQTVEK